MAKMYYEVDANLELLKGKVIAVMGYGSQGHSQSQNLKDSGLKVIIGLRPTSARWKRAKEAGFEVMTVSEAAAKADVIQILLPDETQAKIYHDEIEQYVTTGKTLVFSHGFNIHFGQIIPPTDVDVIMIAPKSPGHLVRRTYTEETETDLFGEQAVLCGGASELVKAGFDTLVEAGYQPEIAYFECLHELKLIVDLMYEGGIGWMRYSVSDTAQYGDMTIGKRIINQDTRKEMKKVLEEIQDGRFAKAWLLESQANRPAFNAMTRIEEEHPIEKVGEKLRGMMSWLKKHE